MMFYNAFGAKKSRYTTHATFLAALLYLRQDFVDKTFSRRKLTLIFKQRDWVHSIHLSTTKHVHKCSRIVFRSSFQTKDF